MARPLIVFDLDDTAIITKPDPRDEMNIGFATSCAIWNIALTVDKRKKSRRKIYNTVDDIYRKGLGGFGNRSSRELVLPLYAKIEEQLGIPAEKILDLSPLEFVKEMRARRLRQMLHYIDREYPRFHPGFVELYEAIISGKINADLAIATSNHHEIVVEIFKKRGLKPPDNIVSEDTILSYGLLPFEKPSPFSMIMADHQRRGWRPNIHGIDYLIDNKKFRAENTIMVGNDPDRDGVMAESGGACYLHKPTTHPDFVPDKRKGQLLVPDYYWLTDYLIEASERAKTEGKPPVFTEAFFGRKEHEIFPRVEGNQGPEERFRSSPERGF